MAIRFVKIEPTMPYKKLKEIEEANGGNAYSASVLVRDTKSEPEIKVSPGSEVFSYFWHVTEDVTEHKGCVVAVEVAQSVRIMSDVWADLTFAVVYEPTGEATGIDSERYHDEKNIPFYGPNAGRGLFRRIQIGNSEFPNTTTSYCVEIDATDEVKEIWKVYQKGLEFASAEKEHNRDMERLLGARRDVAVDKIVRVTKGRKVKQGTEGRVFWVGDSPYGMKVGIALPQKDGSYRMETRTARSGKTYKSYADVVWTYKKNVQVISDYGGRLL